jgi:hypothetical protein
MFDLIALAFDADITRSVAFMLNREDGMGISDTFPLKLGLSKTHHMLDNTIVLFGSGASTTHNSHNLPTMVAGGGNMGLKHGMYWRQDGARMSNMYLSILRAMGIEQESFADSTGTLTSPVFTKS